MYGLNRLCLRNFTAYSSAIRPSYCNLTNCSPSLSELYGEESLIEILVPNDGLFQSRFFRQPPCSGHIFQLNIGYFHLVFTIDSNWLQKINRVYRSLLCIQGLLHARKDRCNLLKLTCCLVFAPGVQPIIFGTGSPSIPVSFPSYFTEIASNQHFLH